MCMYSDKMWLCVHGTVILTKELDQLEPTRTHSMEWFHGVIPEMKYTPKEDQFKIFKSHDQNYGHTMYCRCQS